MVNVGGIIINMTNQPAAGTLMMIPEGFRPGVLTKTNGFIVISNNVNPCVVTISTAGEVKISYSGGLQTTQMYFAGTYPV